MQQGGKQAFSYRASTTVFFEVGQVAHVEIPVGCSLLRFSRGTQIERLAEGEAGELYEIECVADWDNALPVVLVVINDEHVPMWLHLEAETVAAMVDGIVCALGAAEGASSTVH